MFNNSFFRKLQDRELTGKPIKNECYLGVHVYPRNYTHFNSTQNISFLVKHNEIHEIFTWNVENRAFDNRIEARTYALADVKVRLSQIKQDNNIGSSHFIGKLTWDIYKQIFMNKLTLEESLHLIQQIQFNDLSPSTFIIIIMRENKYKVNELLANIRNTSNRHDSNLQELCNNILRIEVDNGKIAAEFDTEANQFKTFPNFRY